MHFTANTGLEGASLLHAFYRWCCREFNEPAQTSGQNAEVSTAAAVAAVAAAVALGPHGRDGGGAGGGFAPVAPVPATEAPGHGWGGGSPATAAGAGVARAGGAEAVCDYEHVPLDPLSYDGSMRLHFKERNTRVHEAADVSLCFSGFGPVRCGVVRYNVVWFGFVWFAKIMLYFFCSLITSAHRVCAVHNGGEME